MLYPLSYEGRLTKSNGLLDGGKSGRGGPSRPAV